MYAIIQLYDVAEQVHTIIVKKKIAQSCLAFSS